MKSPSNCIKSLFMLFSFVASGSIVFAGNFNEIEVIDAMKAFNTLYHSAIHAEGFYSLSAKIHGVDMDLSFPFSELKFTKSDGRCALMQKVADDDSSYRAFLHDGRQAFAMNSKVLGYNSLHVQDSDSNSHLLRQKFVLFALGRGAVVSMNDLIEFQVNEDVLPQTIFLKGKGSNLIVDGLDGVWELEVLPDAGYMIRKAKFYYEGAEGFHYRVETSGVVNNKGCFYPENATIFQRFAGDYIEHKYQFTGVRFEFDDKFYDEVKSLRDRFSEQSGTCVMDDSDGKSEVRVVGVNMRKDYELSPASPSRWGIVIVINLFLIALLFFSIYRNHRMKQQNR